MPWKFSLVPLRGVLWKQPSPEIIPERLCPVLGPACSFPRLSRNPDWTGVVWEYVCAPWPPAPTVPTAVNHLDMWPSGCPAVSAALLPLPCTAQTPLGLKTDRKRARGTPNRSPGKRTSDIFCGEDWLGCGNTHLSDRQKWTNCSVRDACVSILNLFFLRYLFRAQRLVQILPSPQFGDQKIPGVKTALTLCGRDDTNCSFV